MKDAPLKYRKSKPLALLKETGTYYTAWKLGFVRMYSPMSSLRTLTTSYLLLIFTEPNIAPQQ